MNNAGTYFRLFSSCIPVKGQQQSWLFDLERKASYNIPGLLCEVLEKTYELSIAAVKAHYDHQYDEGIDVYLKEFEKLELGFFTEEPEAFPPLKMLWEDPLKIQTAILEIEQIASYDVADIIQQLDQLGCAALQIRCLQPLPLEAIQSILSASRNSRLRSIELYIAAANFKASDLGDLLQQNPRINLLLIHSAQTQKTVSIIEGATPIHYRRAPLKVGKKDAVYPARFVLDVKYFSEAHHFNASLNRKISIDPEGYIRHYPSHELHFGKVQDQRLSAVVQSTEFQEKWYIRNDQIEKCRSCAYRYVCFFNSDLVQKNGTWHKLEDCGYNPFSGKWENLPSLQHQATAEG